MSQDDPKIEERRRDRRRPILATFALFCVIPKKGIHRLQVNNISENGIGFDLDIDGESPEDFKINIGETLALRFYVNLSLYILLSVKLNRIDLTETGRRIGAELLDTESASYQAFRSFISMLDLIADTLQVDENPNLFIDT